MIEKHSFTYKFTLSIPMPFLLADNGNHTIEI